MGSGYDASAVPANVIDQIWLWDRERTRVRLTLVYQHNCIMANELAAIREQAARVILWSSQARQQVYVDVKHAAKLQQFVQQWRLQQQQ
mgnify:CR=1 FL=1